MSHYVYKCVVKEGKCPSHAAFSSISLEKTKYKLQTPVSILNCSVIGCSNSTYKINST